jgi:uncharacterized protein (TIGR00255 family)
MRGNSVIRSMTGYGKGSAELPGVRITVEMKTLNNRFADVRLRLPSELSSEEGEIRRRVLTRVQRGRVEMSLDVERTSASTAGVTLNRPLVRAILDAASQLQSDSEVEGRIDVNTLLGLPNVLVQERPLADLDEAGRAAIHRAVEGALDALDGERRREGEELRTEILARLAKMEGLVREIRGLAAEVPTTARRKLVERIEALTLSVPLDPARLAQETAFLADRCDVTEELVRLEGHVAQARALVESPDAEPVGKRLDFLLQEIHRETNTINSKSGELEISRRALALKSESEKVREQIQNLE